MKIHITKALAVSGLLLLAACGRDPEPTYRFRDQTHAIACDDQDMFVDQYAEFDGSEVVFNEWYNECGDDWIGPAFDAVLEAG